MNEKFKKLEREFKRIREKGYIKGIYNSYSAIGRTFENELGLEMNKECVPDYDCIEIKTRRTYSKSLISLFTAVPDGEKPLELTRIKDRYGYPCKKDRNYKVLYVEAFANKHNFGGIKYQYKLDVDEISRKVYLCIYNKYGNLLEKEVYWSFNYLKERLISKLKLLAIIDAWTTQVDGWNYFKYYKIRFYKLKSFNNFIKLLKEGKIVLRIKIDIYFDKDNYGKMYDHGCSFSIAENEINSLFNRYCIGFDKHI